MADRLGLAQYNTTKMNTVPSALPIGSSKHPGYSITTAAVATTTTTAANGVNQHTHSHHHHHAAAPHSARSDGVTIPAQQPQPASARYSGGKRDIDSSKATDTYNVVSGGAPNAADAHPEKPAKKKVTYALPNQNMEEGHFYVVLGEDADPGVGRFKILSMLGEGTFGKVVEAWDRRRKEYCAVKIVRNVPKYTRDAKVEISFMERVRQCDPVDKYCFMKILRYFQNEKGHVCIVMPKYGPSMLDYITKRGPFSHRSLAEAAFQVFAALDYFHSELHLMHTDLKPENLLLESAETVVDRVTGKQVAKSMRVRICDLGGCCDERHSKQCIVSTRHYRSPEVILGLGWMYSTDMWSMGCIIYELVTGRLLYDTHDNHEHLNMLERSLGVKLPAEWARGCFDACKPFFRSDGALKPTTEQKSAARVSRVRPIKEVITDDLLRDLIIGMLHYDRRKRMTARQAAAHPYIQKYYPESMQHAQHPANNPNLPPTPTQ